MAALTDDHRMYLARALWVGLGAALLAIPQPAELPPWKAAQFRGGVLPLTPVQAVAGGEVFVEATVNNNGAVGDVTTLRTSEPFGQYVLNAVRGWQFQPAEETVFTRPGDPRSIVTRAVESHVLVACIFRPPTLNTPTLGGPPKDVQRGTEDVAVPFSTVTPLYPPLALGDATVFVQVTVDITGSVVGATTLRSVPGFDESALTAARRWIFRPARIHGRLEETLAYLVFAFRQPVT
jgi:TonB family protein